MFSISFSLISGVMAGIELFGTAETGDESLIVGVTFDLLLIRVTLRFHKDTLAMS